MSDLPGYLHLLKVYQSPFLLICIPRQKYWFFVGWVVDGKKNKQWNQPYFRIKHNFSLINKIKLSHIEPKPKLSKETESSQLIKTLFWLCKILHFWKGILLITNSPTIILTLLLSLSSVSFWSGWCIDRILT